MLGSYTPVFTVVKSKLKHASPGIARAFDVFTRFHVTSCADSTWVENTRFVADWLKSKGLHKLCSVFEGIQEPSVLFLACKSVVY